MKRFILTNVAAVLVAVFGCITNVDAAPHKGGSHVVVHAHASVVVHPHPAHAPVVVHGRPAHVQFHVRGYRGWVSRCWFSSYGCYGYYCGTDQLWYYWYAPLNEYLPISYMSVYPPTQGVAPIGVVQVAPGMPALPPGASFVPGPITAP